MLNLPFLLQQTKEYDNEMLGLKIIKYSPINAGSRSNIFTGCKTGKLNLGQHQHYMVIESINILKDIIKKSSLNLLRYNLVLGKVEEIHKHKELQCGKMVCNIVIPGELGLTWLREFGPSTRKKEFQFGYRCVSSQLL